MKLSTINVTEAAGQTLAASVQTLLKTSPHKLTPEATLPEHHARIFAVQLSALKGAGTGSVHLKVLEAACEGLLQAANAGNRAAMRARGETLLATLRNL